jgi:hypothetical protein
MLIPPPELQTVIGKSSRVSAFPNLSEGGGGGVLFFELYYDIVYKKIRLKILYFCLSPGWQIPPNFRLTSGFKNIDSN